MAIARCPVVARAASLRVDEEVFRIVELAVVARADAVDDAVLKVQQNGTRDIVLIIRLVKLCAEKSASTLPHASRALPQRHHSTYEDVFAVAGYPGRVDLDVVADQAILRNAMFQAQLLPEFIPDCTSP